MGGRVLFHLPYEPERSCPKRLSAWLRGTVCTRLWMIHELCKNPTWFLSQTRVYLTLPHPPHTPLSFLCRHRFGTVAMSQLSVISSLSTSYTVARYSSKKCSTEKVQAFLPPSTFVTISHSNCSNKLFQPFPVESSSREAFSEIRGYFRRDDFFHTCRG